MILSTTYPHWCDQCNCSLAIYKSPHNCYLCGNPLRTKTVKGDAEPDQKQYEPESEPTE